MPRSSSAGLPSGARDHESGLLSGLRLPSDSVYRPDRLIVTADKRRAAFVVTRILQDDDDPLTGVWCGELSGEPTLLAAIVPDTNLAFRPDGGAVAYAAMSYGRQQIHVVPMSQQPPRAATTIELPGVAERIEWPAPDRLVVMVAEPGADSASVTAGKPLATEPIDPLVSAADIGWRRLFAIDPDSGHLQQVTPERLTVWEWTSLPDDRVIAVCSSRPSEDGWYSPMLAFLGPTPESYEVLHRSEWQLANPVVDPEGDRVAFVEGWGSDRGLLAGEIRLLDLASGTMTSPPLSTDVTSLSWEADGRLWFAGWEHLDTTWGWLVPGADSEPEKRLVREAAGCLNGAWHPEVIPLSGATALTVRSHETSPPEVVTLRGDDGALPWTTLNASVPIDRGLETQELQWTAADGETVEGLLVLPAHPAQPPPLVVEIHGGPSLAYHHDWELGSAELLTNAGFAVLLPNPRGGAGRGQAFAKANLGDPTGQEYQDVLTGVRHCTQSASVRPDRVAFMGHSYGGYLTAWATSQGADVCCGVVISGISDLLSCWGTANNALFYDNLLGCHPSTDPVRYVRQSPVARLGAHSVPTLILHGEQDRCVPVGQALELAAGLHAAGVELELVVYPREGHQTTEAGHVRDQRARILSWFEKHLRPVPAPSNADQPLITG